MEFTLRSRFNASAKQIYSAWLDSEKHTLMTGGKAICSDKPGDVFTAWDGYINGKNIKLIPYTKIIQSWRTSQFEEGEEDSQIELVFKESNGVTEMTLTHSNVPESGEHYIKGWENHYFKPMRAYFSSLLE